MGAAGSRQLTPVQLRRHQDATGLSSEQLEQLHTRFRALDRPQKGYLTPTDLLRIPQLALNPLHREIVDGFFPSPGSPSARLTFGQFVETCAIFLVPQFGRSSHPSRRDGRSNKLRLVSRMLDTRRSGCISRDDFRQIMRRLLDPKEKQEPEQEQRQGQEEEQRQGHEQELGQVQELGQEQGSEQEPGQDLEQEESCLPEVEVELILLEQQAFGPSDRTEISYEQFEERLCTADIQGRLSIAKWLVDPNPKWEEDSEKAPPADTKH
ncbi:hypothetical protein KR009_006214, partial [Drosophila setifemur]